MARKARQINDLRIDEISLVDKGANQHAVVTIAKSASGEKESEVEIYDEDGNLLDAESLNDGDVVYGEDGQAYLFTLDAGEEDEPEEDALEDAREPELVGKSVNPFRREVKKNQTGSFSENLREELSKALNDRDRDEVISKAFGALEQMEERVSKAQQKADQEREIRLQREYTEIAKSYNLPIDDEELGGVLMRCAEALDPKDCEIIAKCMETAGEAIFEEYGAIGGGDNADVLDMVNSHLDEAVTKSNVSREDLMAEVFATNPDLYDQYNAEHQR